MVVARSSSMGVASSSGSSSTGQPPTGGRGGGKDEARLREVIQGEVLDTRPSVRWDDIAGLSVAKQVWCQDTRFGSSGSLFSVCPRLRSHKVTCTENCFGGRVNQGIHTEKQTSKYQTHARMDVCLGCSPTAFQRGHKGTADLKELQPATAIFVAVACGCFSKPASGRHCIHLSSLTHASVERHAFGHNLQILQTPWAIIPKGDISSQAHPALLSLAVMHFA